MNWDAIGAVAELFGALGVILSLVYLATQVRSSGRMARQEAARSVIGKMGSVLAQMTADHAVADIWIRGSQGLSNLEDEGEYVQFSTMILSVFRTYEELHFYRKDGVDWDWSGFDEQIEDILATPGVKEWWERRGRWFSASFREAISSRMASEARSLYRTVAPNPQD